jgi:pilus assembly protein Flp/PilA
MRKIFAKMRAEDGQGLIEYALILVLISIVCLVALSAMGSGASSIFQTIADTV